MLPTPTVWVQGEVDLDKYLARRAREKAKGRNGNGFGIPIDMAIRLLPTPRAQNGETRNMNLWVRPDGQPPNLEHALARVAGETSGPQ